MSFRFPGGAPSSGSWLPSFSGSQRQEGASSPDTTSLAGPTIVAESPNHLVTDDASFAASYHPETSPLFNPSVMPRSDATPLFEKSPNNTNSLEGQPDATESQDGQSSPLCYRAAVLSPDLSTKIDISIAPPADDQNVIDEDADEQDAIDKNAFNKDADGQDADRQDAIDENAMNEDADRQDTDGQDTDEQDAAKQTTTDRYAETSQETTEAIESSNESEKQLLDEQNLDLPDTDTSGGMGAKPSPTYDGVAEEEAKDAEEPLAHIRTTQSSESAEKTPERTKSPTPDGLEAPSSEGEIAHTTQPTSSPKRSRRTAAEMLSAAAESITKNIDGRRKRFSAIPFSPAVNPSPTSTKHFRKSMPAQGSTQTPRKRGRPRKSDIAATPPTISQSASRRGRPRKSDAVPSAPGSITKRRAGPTPRRTTAIVSATNSTSRIIQPSSATATPQVGRPRKSLGTPSAAGTETPKRRGRPPKNTPQPSLAKVAISQSSGALNGTSRRSVRARAVPSPVKRGRPARNATTSASKPASTRGSRPAAKSTINKSTIVEAPVDPPKRRGRPPKTASTEAMKIRVEKLATNSAPKRRGRGAASTKETPVAPKRRGRPAKSAPVEVAKPPTKKRGRPRQAEAEAKPEPPAKRQRIARQTEEKPTPARKSGRGAAKETSDNFVQPNAEVDAPRTRRSGRGSAELSADKPTEKPAPKPRGRGAKSGKGEIPSSRTATEKEAAKPKRGKVTAPNRVVKKTPAAAVSTRRSTRSRN